MSQMPSNREKHPFEKMKKLYPEETKRAQQVLVFEKINPQLMQVKNTEDWEKLLKKIKQPEI